jgi:hypothetical protein
MHFSVFTIATTNVTNNEDVLVISKTESVYKPSVTEKD